MVRGEIHQPDLPTVPGRYAHAIGHMVLYRVFQADLPTGSHICQKDSSEYLGNGTDLEDTIRPQGFGSWPGLTKGKEPVSPVGLTQAYDDPSGTSCFHPGPDHGLDVGIRRKSLRDGRPRCQEEKRGQWEPERSP